MKKWLLIISTASIILYPLAAGAADYGSSSSVTGSAPPVAQTLVREGDFAIKLAAVLDLGTPATETAAEDLLVKAGIVPLNGWLSDYPVTPQIMGQLQEAVSRSASEGKLPMTSDQGVKGLYSVAAQFNLPTPAGAGQTGPSTPSSTTPYQPDQQAVNDYYSDAGPPVVTYYPPPYDYAYLYAWVPYPVWWFGFWFPGFYICNSFTTTVVFESRSVVVSNHFVDRRTGDVFTVDPDGPRGGHGRRPESVLRTERGEGFLTPADMHRGERVVGYSPERRQGPDDRRFSRGERSWSPDERRSAANIYSRSMRTPFPEARADRVGPMGDRREGQRMSFGTVQGSRAGGERNWSSVPPQRQVQQPLMRPAEQGWDRRSYGAARPFSNGLFTSPSGQRVPTRSLGSSMARGEGGGARSVRPSGGEGWGRQEMGGGGSFSGGYCRGGRC